MRLVTFNAEHGRRRDGRGPGRDPVVDTPALVDALVALRPDVVALQEVDRRSSAGGPVDQAGAVAEALGGESRFAPRRPGGDTGVALVARGSISEVGVLRFVSRWGPRRGGWLPQPLLRPSHRPVLLARVDVDGLALTACSAHLELVRRTSHAQLERLVAALAARPGPHALLGDLNRWTSWVAPTTAAGGLVLVDDDAPTHPAHRPVRRIDHVATAGLRVAGVEVVALPVSDHRALVVDVGPTA